MARQAKPKAKRTQIKDLNIAQQELTTDEATKVKGGGHVMQTNEASLDFVRIRALPTQPQTSSTSLSATKK